MQAVASFSQNLIRSLLVVTVLALSACAIPDEVDPTEGWTAEQLYAAAKGEMDAGRYTDAVGFLEKLDARYPFGKLAQQAQLDMAFSHYKDDERGLALITIDRFVKRYPNHPRLDYIYYLKGLVNFNERRSIISFFDRRDLSERDIRAARESFDAFNTVVTRFPTSRYTADARQRMTYLVNAIASGEVSVARYYFERGAYMAAANRAQEVVREYQRVPAVEQALYIMMASYKALGLDELSQGARSVMEQNFPDSTLLTQGLQVSDDRRWWQVWR
ncbi:MAG: outer membrane protein assembly factor BamD [Burkholderiaceae bacterium]